MKNLLIIFLAIVAVIFGYFHFFPKYPPQTQETSEVTPTEAIPTAAESTASSTNGPSPTLALGEAANPGWKVYTNTKYGFQLSYPENYQVLSDSTNLYGWDHGVVLFYKGGQSYDLAVQVWTSEAEYIAAYADDPRVSVRRLGITYFTLLNQNQTTEVDEIIQTFKAIEQ